MKYRYLCLAKSIFLFGLVMILAGCGNREIAVFENEGGTYSVYGALSADKNPNYIRVKELDTQFLSDSARSIDAEATFEDLQQGTSTVLEDTVVNFSGNYVHNFIVDQPLQPNKTYRFTVNRSDGASVETDVTTPAVTKVDLSISSISADRVEAKCKEKITFSYKNVKKPESIDMEIGIEYNEEDHWTSISDKLRFIDGKDEVVVEMMPSELLVEIFPAWIAIVSDPYRSVCDEPDTRMIRVRYVHYGPEWDRINPDNEPLDPLDSPDIIGEGGLGFLGAYRKGSYEFYMDDSRF